MKNVLSNVALNKVMNIMKGGLNSKESLMETNNDTEIVKDLWHEGEEYTVRFYDASNEIIDEQIVVYGNSAILPSSNPIKDPTVSIVYTFSHWDKDTSRITDNMDVYPVFTESPRLYTVNFLNGDGSLLESRHVPYNTSVPAPGSASKPEDDYIYTFNRWDKDTSVITSDLDVHPIFNSDKLLISPSYFHNDSTKGETYLYFDFDYDLNEDSEYVIIKRCRNKNRLHYDIYDRFIIDGKRYKTKIQSLQAFFYTNNSWEASALETFKFGNYIEFDTISKLNSMFFKCTNIKKIDLSFLNKVNLNIITMESMFNGCNQLNSIIWNENLNTSKVTGMFGFYSMFNSCSSLISLDLTLFDTRNAMDIRRMFLNCTNLKEIKVSRSKWISSVDYVKEEVFKNCGVDHVTYVD